MYRSSIPLVTWKCSLSGITTIGDREGDTSETSTTVTRLWSHLSPSPSVGVQPSRIGRLATLRKDVTYGRLSVNLPRTYRTVGPGEVSTEKCV